MILNVQIERTFRLSGREQIKESAIGTRAPSDGERARKAFKRVGDLSALTVGDRLHQCSQSMCTVAGQRVRHVVHRVGHA